jgi:hypothetical protein
MAYFPEDGKQQEDAILQNGRIPDGYCLCSSLLRSAMCRAGYTLVGHTRLQANARWHQRSPRGPSASFNIAFWEAGDFTN